MKNREMEKCTEKLTSTTLRSSCRLSQMMEREHETLLHLKERREGKKQRQTEKREDERLLEQKTEKEQEKEKDEIVVFEKRGQQKEGGRGERVEEKKEDEMKRPEEEGKEREKGMREQAWKEEEGATVKEKNKELLPRPLWISSLRDGEKKEEEREKEMQKQAWKEEAIHKERLLRQFSISSQKDEENVVVRAVVVASSLQLCSSAWPAQSDDHHDQDHC